MNSTLYTHAHSHFTLADAAAMDSCFVLITTRSPERAHQHGIAPECAVLLNLVLNDIYLHKFSTKQS